MDLPAAFTGLSIDPGTPVRAVSTEGGDGAAGACAGAGSESDDGSDWDDWSEEGDVTAVEQEFAAFLKSMQEQACAQWGPSAPAEPARLQAALGVRRVDPRSWDQVHFCRTRPHA